MAERAKITRRVAGRPRRRAGVVPRRRPEGPADDALEAVADGGGHVAAASTSEARKTAGRPIVLLYVS
ncbi:hypothetical protein E1212_09740 [Jiangella ureilytica]|uniref:Uncharacterized protein n=1 Tax=Jiangella ureilytica TaxID=2530374 RepID=A0A4R4RU93_9ACTN|nr:hypothetical protein [Jiangella ureilytica]TDC52113.1 hypothetical protein E1212_09740 [Jiangella ureilytica]